MEGVEKHIPIQTLKNRASLPYITPEIGKLIRKRDRIYKRREKAQKNFDHSTASYKRLDMKLKDIKREIQRQTRIAFWTYIESIITPMEDEEEWYSFMKIFWTFIKHRAKDYEGITGLNDQGQLHTDPKDKTNILNHQFESVFTKESPLNPDLLLAQSAHPVMPDIHITEPGVQKLLEKLNMHKASGPDEIGPRIFKQLATTITPILIDIYKQSYETGEVPLDWRRANVTPIFKKGRKNDASNYRPISLTCISCKLLEHIITSLPTPTWFSKHEVM